MKELNHRDSLCLQVAEGWIELGSYAEAAVELSEISDEGRAHPHVFRAHAVLYAMSTEGDSMLGRAHLYTKSVQPFLAWIILAHVLHKKGRTAEALDNLLSAVGRLAPDSNVSFYIALYCAKLGRLSEASSWLDKAFALARDKAGTEMLADCVLGHPDLKPFWGQYGERQ
jgi:tetratricopeptide (TPR) repeat protein